MTAFKERAKAIAGRHTYLNVDTADTEYNNVVYNDVIDAIIEAFTEQDSIARAEERERCIRAAQEAVCKVCAACYNTSNCKKDGCGYFNNIRKAIGEEGNND